MRCPGKPNAEAGLPDETSVHAAEGTAAHQLAEWCLTGGRDAEAYIGRVVEVEGFTFTVDDTMADYVQTYVDAVRAKIELADTHGVEMKLGIDEWIRGEFGTADFVAVIGDELNVDDLKYGRGVKVSAEDNEQLMLYALGAYEQYGLIYPVEFVRMTIHQPRMNHTSEEVITVEELIEFAHEAQGAAKVTQTADAPRIPGTKQCRFCRARGDCRELAEYVASEVADEFEDLTASEPELRDVTALTADELARAYEAIDLIEMWVKAVRERAQGLAEAGELPGYKLVEGRRGARQWADEQEAEQTMKTMRIKQEDMYARKLVSPAQAEKLAKAGAIGKRQWPRLQELITQGGGKPTIAPESDPRPALGCTADDFEDVSHG